MSCRRRPEAGARRGARLLAALPAALIALAAGALPGAARAADERFLVGGLLDAEYWQTDDASLLLSRNGGGGAPAGRLRLWAAADFAEGLQGFALGRTESGRGSEEGETEVELEQAFLRYTFRAPLRLRLEAGVLPVPIGDFARRYMSNVNPLIGSPDGYSVSYPAGVQVIGMAGALDFRVAIVDLPFINEDYVPEPGSAPRPALAAGVTPITGARFGAYATRGPYLGPAVDGALPAGSAWEDFGQSVAGVEAQFSRGHFEAHADLALSRYEVPGLPRDARGKAWYVEPKFTFTPRLFAALRFERNDYPYIAPVAPGVWIGSTVEFTDIEAGIGWRLGPDTIFKASYRRDDWNVSGSLVDMFPDGHAFAVQVSHSFSVNSWFDRPR